MNQVAPPRPVVLAILDGWGDREQCEMNAICQAATPNLDRFNAAGPRALINASELHVGLPSGQMGNSEVGHMNLGAGRVVLQDLPRIDEAIDDGRLTGSAPFEAFVTGLQDSGGTAHLMGLLSPGGVHSHQDHMAALANTLLAAGVPVKVHAFLDGRDTPPRSALEFLTRFESATEAPVATVSGRYYVMDRDKRWDRSARAYRTLVMGRLAPEGGTATDAHQAIEQAYEAGLGDEFVPPTAIGDFAGIADGDGLLMANFRSDRVRQLLRSLLDPAFDGFTRDKTVEFAATLGMVSYSSDLDPLIPALLPPLDLDATLGSVVAEAGLKQLRIAETEKYAHVTFFFNGGRESEFDGEERIRGDRAPVRRRRQRPLRFHRGQLRQRRHGGPYGQHGGRHAGRGSGRPLPGAPRKARCRRRRMPADHLGPRQRGTDGRPGERPAPYCPYHEPGSCRFGECAGLGRRPHRRPPGRHRAHRAAAHEPPGAGGHDRPVADPKQGAGRRRRSRRSGGRMT
jgi:bisphosphoglycerate-independent phosphoglycerate mutase